MTWPCDETYLVEGYLGQRHRRVYFCCVIGFRGDRCTFAAPILRRYVHMRSRQDVRDIMRRRGWRVVR